MARKIDANYELLRQIKAREDSKRVLRIPEPEATISFEEWWMQLTKRIVIKVWMKEILMADFKGRGLSMRETAKRFDEALRLFGIVIP